MDSNHIKKIAREYGIKIIHVKPGQGGVFRVDEHGNREKVEIDDLFQFELEELKDIEQQLSNYNKEKVFTFLDELRVSGKTNMYGAAPYIVGEFDIDMDKANSYLVEWMNTFEERHTEIEQERD